MMHRETRPPQISLPAFESAGQSFGREITVDMESFFEFSFWMAEELLDLEASYSDQPRLIPPTSGFSPGLGSVKAK